jgi:hypothetical protein
MDVDTRLVGESLRAVWALEAFHPTVHVHMALKVALEVKALLADVASELGIVKMHFVDV